jgi:hypothetical protein
MSNVTSPAEVDLRLLATRESFRELVVEHCQPVIIRGLCSDWPLTRSAAQSATAACDYLIQFDSGRAAEAFVGAPMISGRYHYDSDLAGFNFDRETMTLSAALRRILAGMAATDTQTIYVGSLPSDSYLPGFAEHHRVGFLPDGARPRLWAGHASVVGCHHDNSDNLACAVAGNRRFTLFPPDAIGDLYVGPIDHTMAGQPVGLAVGAEADDPRYPRYPAAREKMLVADLSPGDALYLPKLWWHQVEATDPFNLLVNFWWDATGTIGDSPYTTMLLAAAAIAERPPEERKAWQAFFDHYAFRPHGHPLAHLPAERHGILGSGQGGKLRALAMRMLRGR